MQKISNLNEGYSSTSMITTAPFNEVRALPLKLLDEVWKMIFSEGNLKDLYHCSLVDKNWNLLTNDSILAKQVIFKNFCFNPSHWNRFCGKDTLTHEEQNRAYQLLPNTIKEFVKSNCPVFTGKKIIDTHILVWIPETIRGKSVKILNVGQLLKELPEFSGNDTGYRHLSETIVLQKIEKPVKSGWVLMTTDLIGDSQNKSFKKQQSLIENLNKTSQLDYRVPKIVEAILCITAVYLSYNKRLFNNGPGSFIRCYEEVLGNRVEIGGVLPFGFIINHFHSIISEDIGVAVLREFS